MRQNKKAILELFSLGLMSSLFAMAFFFGLLYPEYGMAKGTYQILDETLIDEEAIDLEDLDPMKLKDIPREKIVYRSYFLKCLKTI